MSVRWSDVAFKGAAPGAMEASLSDLSTCGVCKRNGGTVVFPTSTSTVLHNECYQSIKPIADRVAKIVNDIVPTREIGGISKIGVHIAAVRAVEKVIDPGTISSYLSENGMEALIKLFDTVGMDAAKAAAISYKKWAPFTKEIDSLMNVFNAFEVVSPEKSPSS